MRLETTRVFSGRMNVYAGCITVNLQHRDNCQRDIRPRIQMLRKKQGHENPHAIMRRDSARANFYYERLAPSLFSV